MKRIEPWMPERLERTEQPGIFYEAKERDERIEERHVQKLRLDAADLSLLCFSKVRFENCIFQECSFHKCEFTDVIFQGCDFSNAGMTDTYFNRCQFFSSKGAGADFSGSSIQNVLIQDCSMNYVNLDGCRLEKIRVENTEMNSGYLSACRCRDVEWERVQLRKTSFFHTPLQKMDFTTCVIDGMILSDDLREVKGAVVDLYQAAELARRLGVIIK